MSAGLADRDKRSPVSLVVASNPRRPRVKLGLSVDEEPVLVVPVVERDLDKPRAIRLPMHRVHLVIPAIELSY